MSSRVRLWALLGPVGLGVAAGYLGSALHPTLAVDHPALLIALNPRNYHLALVAGEIAFGLYFAIGFARLVTLDPLLYLTGRWYGPAARRWVARRVEGSDRLVALVDRWFPRISWLIVFAAPNLIVCLLAGVTRMRPIVFGLLNVSGTVARLAAVWWLAGRFTDQLDAVLDFFERYQRPATLVAIGLVAVQVLVSTRRGTGEIDEVRDLAEEVSSAPGPEGAPTPARPGPDVPATPRGDDT